MVRKKDVGGSLSTSWHLNHKGKSFISDIISLMGENDDYFIDIVCEHEVFSANHKDEIIIGVGCLLIKFAEGNVVLINTNKIEYIDLRRPSKNIEE